MRRNIAWLAFFVLPLGCSGGEDPMSGGSDGTGGDGTNAPASGGSGNGSGGSFTGANSGGVGGAEASICPDGAHSGGAAAITAEYPAGPYGEGNPVAGEVIENLMLEGYANPGSTALATEQPFGPYSMADLRLSGPRYALIHIGTVW